MIFNGDIDQVDTPSLWDKNSKFHERDSRRRPIGTGRYSDATPTNAAATRSGASHWMR